MNPARLRQIAILVDSLDVDRADRLLEQLPEQTQRQVRDAVMDLEPIDERERQAIIADFVSRGQKSNNATPNRSSLNSPSPSSVSHSLGTSQIATHASHSRQNSGSGNPVVQNSGAETYNAGTYGDPGRSFGKRTTPTPIGNPLPNSDLDAQQFQPLELPTHDRPADESDWAAFAQRSRTNHHTDDPLSPKGADVNPPESDRDLVDALSSADIDTLASVVMKESPQVLAVVLSLLPAQKSAQLLDMFPAVQQQDALRRLGQLDEIDEEVLDYLQQQLNLVIRRRIKLKKNQRTGPAALASILSAAKRLQANQVVNSVEREMLGQDAMPDASDPPAFQYRGYTPTSAAISNAVIRNVVPPLPQDAAIQSFSARNAYNANSQVPQQPTTHFQTDPTALKPNPSPPRNRDLHPSDSDLDRTLPPKPLATDRAPTAAQREERFVSNEIDSVDAFLDADIRMTFQQFYDCERKSLQAVLATAKPKLTLLALRGAAPKLLNRILKMLPAAEAKEVEYRIQNLGPTRLQDIQEAQQYLLRIASVLQDMGQFQLPKKRLGIL